MSRWAIPNQGDVVLILSSEDGRRDKDHLLQALDSAAKAGELRGDLDRFRVLLASHIELDAALVRAAA